MGRFAGVPPGRLGPLFGAQAGYWPWPHFVRPRANLAGDLAPSNPFTHFSAMRPLQAAGPLCAGEHYIALPLAVLFLLACEQPTPGTWPAAVEVSSFEVSERFRTFGPSQTLIAGPDTVPVTLGYYCSVGGPYWADPDYDIFTAWDGLFLQVAQDSATFVGIQARHSFPDSILLGVDAAELRSREYVREIESAGGYIRIPMWSPPVWQRFSIATEMSSARSLRPSRQAGKRRRQPMASSFWGFDIVLFRRQGLA